MKDFEEHLSFPSDHAEKKQQPAEQKFSDSVEYFREVFNNAGVDSDITKKFLAILERDIGFLTEFQSIWGIVNIAEKNLLLRAVALALSETQGIMTSSERDDLSDAIELLSQKGNGITDENWLYLEIVNRRDIKHDLLHRIGEHHEHAKGAEIFSAIHDVEQHGIHLEGIHNDIPHTHHDSKTKGEEIVENEKIVHHIMKKKHERETAAQHETPQQQILPEDIIAPNDDDDDSYDDDSDA